MAASCPPPDPSGAGGPASAQTSIPRDPPGSAGTARGPLGQNPYVEPRSVKQTVGSIFERLGEIREYAGYYASTQTDAIKTKITYLAIYAVLGMVGAVIGLAVLVTAAVLLVHGIAAGLNVLFNSVWLGQLVTGLLLLTLLAVGAFVAIKVISGTSKRKLMAKYEQRHKDQQARYGADVLQRARERQEQQAVS